MAANSPPRNQTAKSAARSVTAKAIWPPAVEEVFNICHQTLKSGGRIGNWNISKFGLLFECSDYCLTESKLSPLDVRIRYFPPANCFGLQQDWNNSNSESKDFPFSSFSFGIGQVQSTFSRPHNGPRWHQNKNPKEVVLEENIKNPMLVHAATNWPPMNQATHHRTNHNSSPMEKTKSFHCHAVDDLWFPEMWIT